MCVAAPQPDGARPAVSTLSFAEDLSLLLLDDSSGVHKIAASEHRGLHSTEYGESACNSALRSSA